MIWIEVLKVGGIVFGLLWLGGLAWLAFVICNAPEGYEDEDGFHRL